MTRPRSRGTRAGVDRPERARGSRRDRHLAGRTSATAGPSLASARSSIRTSTATRFLAATAAALEPRPSVLVCAGGVDVYGDRGDEILTEESTLGAGFLADVGRRRRQPPSRLASPGFASSSFRQGIVLAKDGGALDRMLPSVQARPRRASGERQAVVELGRDRRRDGRRTPSRCAASLSGPVNLYCAEPGDERAVHGGAREGASTTHALPGARSSRVRALYGEMGVEVLIGGQRVLPARLLDAGFEFSAADDRRRAHAGTRHVGMRGPTEPAPS